MNQIDDNQKNIIIYENDEGDIRLDVFLENETVWLNQGQMAMLFNKARRTIGEHIQNIYVEGELKKEPTRRNFRQVQDEGSRVFDIIELTRGDTNALTNPFQNAFISVNIQ